MLSVFNQHKQLLLQWPQKETELRVEFYCRQTELLSHAHNQEQTLLFYGYLDMDWHSYESPAEFLQNKYKNSLPDHLDQLFGSFIILIYQEQSFTLVNDAMGDFLPSFEHINNLLKISDFADSLFNQENIAINPLRVAHYFASTQPLKEIGFFQSIKQLSGGERLRFSEAQINVNKYYKPRTVLDLQHKDVSYWSRRLQELLQLVISYQCYGCKSVHVQLSGGLDSSLVMAMAKETGLEINTHSYVFPGMPEADESLWIESMSRMDIKMNRFVGESQWPVKYPWPVSAVSPMSNPYRHLKQSVYSKVATQKDKILLTGVFADHLYTGYIYWLIDSIKSYHFHGIQKWFKGFQTLGWKKALQQLSPKKWQKTIKPIMPGVHQQWMSQIKQEWSDCPASHPHPEQFHLVIGSSTAQSCFFENEWAFKKGIHIRHPFRDRRIIEFLLQAPAWVLGDVFQPKSLARHAGKHFLPDSVTRRTQVTSLNQLFIKGVLDKEISRVQSVLTDSSCNWQDYLQADIIDNILKNPKSKHADKNLFLLWQCISYELWRNQLLSIS